MSESEKNPKEDPAEAALPESSSHPVVEIDELDDFDDFSPLPEKEPSIRDFLKSPDSPSRYFMVLALIFGALAACTLSILVYQYVQHRRAAHPAKAPVTTAKLEPTYDEKMGEFKVSWSDGELRGDLVVQCATLATCEELKNRKIEARDRVLSILQGSSRSEILNPAKKQMLRQQITDSLNEMKFSGKIVESNFSDLTVEIAH